MSNQNKSLISKSANSGNDKTAEIWQKVKISDSDVLSLLAVPIAILILVLLYGFKFVNAVYVSASISIALFGFTALFVHQFRKIDSRRRLDYIKRRFYYASLENPNGFTMDIENGGKLITNDCNINSGFIVGVKNFKTQNELIEYVERENKKINFRNFNRSIESKLYAGYWNDSKTGLNYFDAVRIYADKEKAIQTAKRHGERAIFSLSSFIGIYI